jgi:hypothetical protein
VTDEDKASAVKFHRAMLESVITHILTGSICAEHNKTCEDCRLQADPLEAVFIDMAIEFERLVTEGMPVVAAVARVMSGPYGRRIFDLATDETPAVVKH